MPTVAIAEALALLGPRAARAADVIREDARTSDGIAQALRQIEGPWEASLPEPLPYLGESVRLDGPCNDRIFEGLRRQDGRYHIRTGS